MASVFIVVNIAGRDLHGVGSVAAGASGVGVVCATAAGNLAARVAEADADGAGATSTMLDVSDLTASRSHS